MQTDDQPGTETSTTDQDAIRLEGTAELPDPVEIEQFVTLLASILRRITTQQPSEN